MPESMKQITFTKLDEGMGMPHLLDIQTRAFQSLLQKDATVLKTEDVGLERVFRELFPISDVHENFSLEFVSYVLGEPKYSVGECIERDMTYSAPLKATLQLVINEDVNGLKRPRNIIQKEVYLGELPLLTELGTFVINGAERVIVSQLHRSPGVVFEESIHPNGTKLYSARIIPFRGSWVEFTIDIHDVVAVHIDKQKKFPATALLRTVGYSRDADILSVFFKRDAVTLASMAGEGTREGRRGEVFHGFLGEDVPDPALLGPEGPMLYREVVVPGTGEVFERGSRLTTEAHRAMREGGVYSLPVIASALLARAGDEVNAEVIGRL